MKQFLLEIGTEEIPARFIKGGLDSLKSNFINFLTQEAITYGKIKLFATPRRLAIIIDDVAEKQEDRVKEMVGPPTSIAYDKDGGLTKAAVGFAKSAGIDVSELKVLKNERGEYLQAVVQVPGMDTKDLFSKSLPGLITSLYFPKTMRWAGYSTKFVRPVRWILALMGSEVISFELEGIKSSNLTYGHRFSSPQPVKVADPSSYASLLNRNKVIADLQKRKEIIVSEIKKVEQAEGCIVHEDEELLDTVVSLVEYPTVIVGGFDNDYLLLPKELPITVMRIHQKYFSLEDMNGNLLPKFIVVSNSVSDNKETVRKGNERVLRARLEDARFYYNDDLQKPLWELKDELKNVTFQEELGSIFDKLERVSFICSFIAARLDFKDEEKLLRAAMLSKADLVSGVVGEFPELQGYMGKVYAIGSGEDEDVADAIYEHYLPRFAEDVLPSSDIGSIISIADKADNIASFFFLGMIPTGSEDPFALRRQAAGIIRILQEKDYPLTLENIIETALQSLENHTPSIRSLTEKILVFFNQRLEGILLSQGYSYDTVNAVLSVKGLTMKGIKEKMDILAAIRKEAGFEGLLTSAKRVYNILGESKAGEVRKDLFIEESEKALFDSAESLSNEMDGKDFSGLFRLQEPINIFFDKVLVMDKDAAVKANRLALLSKVKSIFDTLADFSRIVQ
ncbi:MAG: glycine--tRNA ligase subunit beta [Thermodesulfovibrionia bacterium]|nr:glycine--tRNA ligase subunit beta [Thermodesulfovibrionia bacterium]